MEIAWRALRAQVVSPGAVLIVASRHGVVAVSFTGEREGTKRTASRIAAALRATPAGMGSAARSVLDRAIEELGAYFRGERVAFSVPLDLEARGTDFQRRVWAALRRIPHGELTTYGRLAASIGHSRGARAVGGAVGRNPVPIIVPCHRVVGEDGSLTGFSSGLAIKVRLLRLEGFRVGAGSNPARRRLVPEGMSGLREVS